MSSKDLIRWADAQQYHQETEFNRDSKAGGVVPRVTLLSMTPDPLGVIAAMCGMYEGRVVRDLAEVSDQERQSAFSNVLATHLDTPLEAVQLHFLLEGVDRSFTHQLVRQRVGAAYAQESLRFAVVDDLRETVVLPPSLAGTHRAYEEDGHSSDDTHTQAQRWRNVWDEAIADVNDAYRKLVDSGMPSEEARGLLPHATATRIHYVTNLRALGDHAGNRLCTQAQFHWRWVFAQIMDAIRTHQEQDSFASVRDGDAWQYKMIADSEIFRPVCYRLGRCPFKASFDRECSIRERVEIRSKHGSTDSSQWDKPLMYDNPQWKVNQPEIQPQYLTSEGIHTEEWLANPAAARR